MTDAKRPRHGTNGHAPPLRLLSLSEFLQPPKVSKHIGRLVPERAIIVVFGPPKCGKSYAVGDLTMHAAQGMDWHGCRVREPKRVAYLCGEGAQWMRVRLKAWFEHHDSVEPSETFKVFDKTLSLPERVDEVIEMLREFRPDIVVPDTLNAYFGAGDENSTQDMSAFCDAIRKIRDALGCSIIIIHHTGHEGVRERGSIALRGTADVLVQVAKDEKNGLVGFHVLLARDIDPWDKPLALRLVRHETEWLDEDGEPMVACIVDEAATVTLPGRGKGGRPAGSGKNQERAQIAIAEWARGHPQDEIITSLDMTALLQAHGIKAPARRTEVLNYLINGGLLTRSVAGHTINRTALK